jgi:hypothetical protein
MRREGRGKCQQRERWPARVLLLVDFAREKERRKNKKRKNRWFGQFLFEF